MQEEEEHQEVHMYPGEVGSHFSPGGFGVR